MNDIDKLILKVVKSETLAERAEALAELKTLVIIPLQEQIKDQKETITLQNKTIDNNIAEIKVKNKVLAEQKETIKEHEINAVKNKEEIDKLNSDLATKRAIVDDLSKDCVNKRNELTKAVTELAETKLALNTEKTKKSMVEDKLSFFGAFSILEVNTKFNIPSGKLMKWCRKNKYVASLKMEVLPDGEGMFKLINKGGFQSIGVTPKGVQYIKDNLAEIIA